MKDKALKMSSIGEARVIVQGIMTDLSTFKDETSERFASLESGINMESPALDMSQIEDRLKEIGSGIYLEVSGQVETLTNELTQAVNDALASVPPNNDTPDTWEHGLQMLMAGEKDYSDAAFNAVNTHLANRGYELTVKPLGTVSVAEETAIVQANENATVEVSKEFRVLIDDKPFGGSFPGKDGKHIRLVQPGEVVEV